MALLAEAGVTTRLLESMGVRVVSIRVATSASETAGSASPSTRGTLFCPRGQSARAVTEAGTSAPFPALAGVVTGVVPSSVTEALTVSEASTSRWALSASVRTWLSTVATASTWAPPSLSIRVRGLRVKPVSRCTLAAASTLTPDSAGTIWTLPPETVTVTGSSMLSWTAWRAWEGLMPETSTLDMADPGAMDWVVAQATPSQVMRRAPRMLSSSEHSSGCARSRWVARRQRRASGPLEDRPVRRGDRAAAGVRPLAAFDPLLPLRRSLGRWGAPER